MTQLERQLSMLGLMLGRAALARPRVQAALQGRRGPLAGSQARRLAEPGATLAALAGRALRLAWAEREAPPSAALAESLGSEGRAPEAQRA